MWALLAQLASWAIKNGTEIFEVVDAIRKSFKEGALDKDELRRNLEPFDVDGSQTAELMAILDDPAIAAAEKKLDDVLE